MYINLVTMPSYMSLTGEEVPVFGSQGQQYNQQGRSLTQPHSSCLYFYPKAPCSFCKQLPHNLHEGRIESQAVPRLPINSLNQFDMPDPSQNHSFC